MNQSNKLTMTVLSLLMVSGLAACNNSSSVDQNPSALPPGEEVQETTTQEEAIITLERVKMTEPTETTEPVKATTETAETAETYARQYTITVGENSVLASFQVGKEKYGNKNTMVGDTEYVINDLCADENCTQIVSLISKVTKDEVKQDTYLYQLDSDKYSLVCKTEDTKFEQQEDALAFATKACAVTAE